MKKIIIFTVLSVFLGTLLNPMSVHAEDINAHIKSVNKKIKKKDSQYFSGAMVYKNNLVLILKNDVSTDLTVSKTTKKQLLIGISNELYKYKDNSLANEGILVIGGYVKDDDGEKQSTISVYYSKENLSSSYLNKDNVSYSDRMNDFRKDPVGVLTNSTYYYINGLYTKAIDSDFNSKAPFNGMSLVNQEGAPDWILDFNSNVIYPKSNSVVE